MTASESSSKSAAPKRKPAARKTTAKPRASKSTNAQTSATSGADTIKRPSPTMTVKEYTEEERQSLLTSYSALKGAGLPVPDEIAKPVEGWIKQEEKRREAEAKEQQKLRDEVEKENAAGPFYVRNGYSGAPLSIRLERQTERRRIQLTPRGTPGDMHPLEEGDLKDPILKRNIQVGVCEIIPAGEANRIAAQQTTNMGRRVHTPTALLRNERGEEYAEGAVKTEIEYGQQGITVGVIDPEQMQGKYEDRQVSNSAMGGIERVGENEPERKRSVASQFIPTGGNPHIIESGPVQTGDIPQLDAAKAKIADDLARRRGLQGPAAALQGMRITVNAPEKS